MPRSLVCACACAAWLSSCSYDALHDIKYYTRDTRVVMASQLSADLQITEGEAAPAFSIPKPSKCNNK